MNRIVINLCNGGISSVSGLPDGYAIEVRDFDFPEDYQGPNIVVTEEGIYQRVVIEKNGDC